MLQAFLRYRVIPKFAPMSRLTACILCFLFLLGCKTKKKNAEVPADQFFPVPTYIKGELARLDTSLASFYKIEMAEGRSDTVPIRNTEVRRYAADFANLPDISSPELKDDYQVTQAYDDILGSYVFMFTTTEDHPVRREDVVLDTEPNPEGKNNIQSIFVERWENKEDTAIRKNMLWNAGKNFQITTITEASGTQKTKRLQVVWNGFNSNTR
jgi:hypothetical protein